MILTQLCAWCGKQIEVQVREAGLLCDDCEKTRREGKVKG
jgi:hypothetical protein